MPKESFGDVLMKAGSDAFTGESDIAFKLKNNLRRRYLFKMQRMREETNSVLFPSILALITLFTIPEITRPLS